VAHIITRTSLYPFMNCVVTAACTRAGKGSCGGPEVRGVSVVGDLGCVTEHVKNSRYSVAVSVTPKTRWSRHRGHQSAWDLDSAGVELVVNPLNSIASGGG
jgi:hypothetical protein